MSVLKRIIVFIIIFLYICLGLMLNLVLGLIWSRLRYRLISNLTKLICVWFKKILGIKVEILGQASYFKERGIFIISNHQSYLDGVILASLFPVIFISKLQVKSWPVFGWLAQIGGTIFIDRERKLKSKGFIDEISDTLRKKINVLLFPEGTSTDGSKILSFQSVFFQPPLDSCAGIVPITIQYTKIDSQNVTSEIRDKVCWYGQTKFFKHVLEVLKLNKIEVRINIHQKIEIDSGSQQIYSRKQLGELSRQIILNDFSFIQ